MGTVSINWLILLILGCVTAFFIGRLTSKERQDNKRLRTELEQRKEEIVSYRSQVTNHFRETARRVNTLTENYRNVYEHLAQGAKDLCGEKNAPELMSELKSMPVLTEQVIEETVGDQKNVPEQTDTDPEITDEKKDYSVASTASKEKQPEPAAPETVKNREAAR